MSTLHRWTASLALLAISLGQQTISIQSFTAPSSCGSAHHHQNGCRSASALYLSTTNPNVRFLGKGSHAVVRPGTVMVAPQDEFHHFYRQAAIFIYAMGEDEDTDEGRYMIRGAILDHPTPFTLGEMADSSLLEGIKDNPMAENLIHRGGDKGGDNVFMLHNQPEIGDGDMIGTSGVFQGGLQEALEACKQGKAKPEDFKFFFNFCQWTEEELESMLDDDPWIAVEVPADYVLSAEWDRSDCWKQLRNALRGDADDDDAEEDPYE
ncbi:Uncharacterized ACR, COG1678 [Seminavis robusta]|uniref:Uncharacterized ACR, COG1678 n=1 Tax=Seminavis robusta TaxID=568900 RepID=A0A9N8DCM8_9STRA|nr:Uncharacterized ACR, COG1678 [Seminavis robusta]|eukprot:Sro58_g033880.1 Uncharacterized ACR, COG1678 (265) ;mRNA; f:112828-113622